MQKFLSYLIVFILSVLPIVNTSASLLSCERMMDESISQPMSAEFKADMDNASKTTSMHDCSETQKITCDYASGCDSSQVSYSAFPSIQITPPQYFGSYKPRYIYPLFDSKPSDSLYRPPIVILI